MYSVMDIASYFIKKAIAEKNYLTPIQVMKLCYFAHGYKLAIDDTPLVDETVQAWKYGPVFKDLYHVLKLYGNKQINRIPILFENDEDVIKDDDIEILDAVFESLADMDGMSLSDLTHEENSPWHQAWEAQGKNTKYTPIENESIKNYFQGMLND